MATAKHSPQKSSKLVDDQLEAYRSMRDFSVTSEPDGAVAPKGAKSTRTRRPTKAIAKTKSGALPFVIQKHAASHLHYDFRLAWNGVLKSWAVAKGPSYVTKDKRLAVQVEDHPIDYGGFEGVIPQGQYGGGTVLLWDTGTWDPQPGHTDVDAGLIDGSLKFILHGTKMKGKWALIRMGGKAANAKKPNWLLIKEHDSHERTEEDPAITDESPESVVTGRSLDEIAAQKDHIWNSSAGKSTLAKKQPRQPAIAAPQVRFKPAAKSGNLSDYPKERLPEFIPPQLAFQSESAPIQEGWLHELKLDGYRIQAHKDGPRVKLFTRTGLDWTHRMQAIASELTRLPAETAIIDGEVVVFSADGTTSFADLQASFRQGEKHPLTYVAFDLLHLDGHDLRGAGLKQRKVLLASLIAPLAGDEDRVRFSEHLEEDGPSVFSKACELHAEGIISKRASGRYVSGRSRNWLKIKCSCQQEFVIGGFTLPSNGTHGVGALLLGYYDDHGRLIYAGRTGTGFTQKTHRLMRDSLEKLRVKKSEFESVPPIFQRGAIWVRPELVAQVAFATWTSDNLVRQAAFKGLRDDKPAMEVQKEKPLGEDLEQPAKAAAHTTRAQPAAKSIRPGSGSKADTLTASEEHAKVRLTHPDKILDQKSHLTKQQLADYYWSIAKYMLPQIANRPLSLVRCPEGSTKPCFFQKHTNSTLPTGIETVGVPDKKTGVVEPYITLSTRESLAALAQMGVLELHPWGSQNDDLEHPDRIIIDLDPDESIAWQILAGSAKQTRDLFTRLGLESFLKSTGGKGLHVVVPIAPEHDWQTIKQFAHAVATALEKQEPALYLTKMSKAARKGKIFIDYLRNERGATAVAAFSPRARAGATVSMPLDWSEIDSETRPVFSVADFAGWKSRLTRDPWKRLATSSQKINITKVAEVL